jgi:hypothetical protein
VASERIVSSLARPEIPANGAKERRVVSRRSAGVRHGLFSPDTSHRALADLLHPAEPARREPHLPKGRQDALRRPPVAPVCGDKP